MQHAMLVDRDRVPVNFRAIEVISFKRPNYAIPARIKVMFKNHILGHGLAAIFADVNGISRRRRPMVTVAYTAAEHIAYTPSEHQVCYIVVLRIKLTKVVLNCNQAARRLRRLQDYLICLW